jgi:hypothetical protein
LGVTSTVAKATERIGIAVKASPSLAGKQVAILKTSNGTTRVVSTGMSLSDAGMASSYLFLQQDGDLQAVIAAKPLVAGPYDPKTQLVAESGVIHITITGGS